MAELKTSNVTWGSANARGRARLVYTLGSSGTDGGTYKVSWTLYAESAYQYGTKVTATLSGADSGSVSKTPSSGEMSSSWVSAKKTGTYSVSKGHSSASKTFTIKASSSSTSTTKSNSVTFTVPARTYYTVSFNANGGTGAPGSQTKWYNETLTLSTTKPTRTGYTFLGWSTSASATSATYSAGGSYTSNSGATLYAVWKELTYTITYNGNGDGSSVTVATQTKSYTKDLTLTGSAERQGFLFLGWSTSSTSTSPTYTTGSTFTTNANTTLYAVWSPAEFAVTFFANGGSNAPNPITYDGNVEGASYPLTIDFRYVSNPTRDYYNFVGWSTTQTGTAQYGTGTGLSSTGQFYTGTELYAVWTNKTARITLYAIDNVATYQTVNQNVSFTLPTSQSIADMAQFLGWVDTKDTYEDGAVKYQWTNNYLVLNYNVSQTLLDSIPFKTSDKVTTDTKAYYSVYKDISPSTVTMNSYGTARPEISAISPLDEAFPAYQTAILNDQEFLEVANDSSSYIFGYLDLANLDRLSSVQFTITSTTGTTFDPSYSGIQNNRDLFFWVQSDNILLTNIYTITVTGVAEYGKQVEFNLIADIESTLIDITPPQEVDGSTIRPEVEVKADLNISGSIGSIGSVRLVDFTDDTAPQVMLGEGLETTSENQTAIGKYNKSVEDDNIAFYIGNGGEPTDLTDTTWIFNDTLVRGELTPEERINWSIDFISNEENYTDLYVFTFSYDEYTVSQVAYMSPFISPYTYYNGWSDTAYKTITITGGTDTTNPELIEWLLTNATNDSGISRLITRSNVLTVDWDGNATFSGSGAMVVAESDDTNTRTEFTAARTDTNVAAGVIVGSGGENRGLYQWSDYENRAGGSWIIYQSSNGINLPTAPYIANHDSPIGTNITGSYKFTSIASSSSLREIGKLKNSSGTDVTFNAGVWIVSVSVRLASYTGSFAAQLTGRSSSYASVMAGTSGTWAVSITDCVSLSSNSTIGIAERHGTGSKDVEVYWSAIRIV